jgi:hypothetical protein
MYKIQKWIRDIERREITQIQRIALEKELKEKQESANSRC